MQIYDVIIVGGGMAGLTAAIELSRDGRSVLVVEKKDYPHHKVCGEYISNEVLPYLKSLGFDPFAYGASSITRLRVSSPAGKNIYANLDLGGFGISRFNADFELYKLAIKNGAEVLVNTRVTDVGFADNSFTVETLGGIAYNARMVIGSYGKRETLDKKLNREFAKTHTGYMGVKYHIRTDYPVDEIGLDNFENGYCGISRIEEGKYNLCYLYKRAPSNHQSIPELEETVLHKNPVLKNIFRNSEFLFDAPLAINQISFARKTTSERHMLMCGDTAGLITPLCGNGMSMAIGGARLLTKAIRESGILDKPEIAETDRSKLEQQYASEWNYHFKRRLFWGRTLQNMLGNTTVTGLFLSVVHTVPALERKLISLTHGKEWAA